jgi:hypothetical protein
MALLALHRLGASDARLREFATDYAKQLSPKPADEARHVAHFEESLQAEGRDALLTEALPRLTPAIGSAAFHGLIRTAYAVDSGDDVDLPDGLAYWETAYIELGGPEGDPRFDTAAEAFAALHRDEALPKQFSGRLIMGALRSAVAHPAFADYLRPIRNLTLEDLAHHAVLVYLATGDFTALHLVTGCHATRVLSPWLSEHALQHLAIALLAGYAALGRPAYDVALAGDVPEWDEISARAIESNDDHDLKLVYSAREEEAHYGWGLHRRAAALRMGMGTFTSSPP